MVLADEVAERFATRVREALALTGHDAGMDEAVDAAREAMISADAVSLFGMETDHPEHGPVRWIVGQSEEPATNFVVLALTGIGESGERGLHAASAEDLSDALLKLAPAFSGAERIVAPAA